MKTLVKIFIIINAMLIVAVATGQHFDKDYQLNKYSYFSMGSSYAKVPHIKEFTPNVIATAGVFYNGFDVSLNYEYVKLTPDYHSYFAQVMYRPFTIRKFEFLAGVKYGRIIRETEGTYSYLGFTGEIRYNINKFFISLQSNYDRRGDILYKWGGKHWKYTTHLKIGIKI